jgi:hypothetical protein
MTTITLSSRPKQRTYPRISLLLLPVLALALTATRLQAQGCAQCRDNLVGTAPATQRAYRNAILLLAIPATGFFIATMYIFKRNS